MSPETVVADLVALALVACLAGLLVRDREMAAPAFVVYLVSAITCNRLITWWPDTFHRRAFWEAKETLYALLCLVIAFDLASRALVAFPRARRFAHAGLGIAILLAAAGPAIVARGGDAGQQAFALLLAWASAAATWAFVALLVVATWFELPLHALHRAICLGFVLYLWAYATLLDLLARSAYHDVLVRLDPAAYAATVGLWTLAAWRREASDLGPVTRTFYPWVRT